MIIKGQARSRARQLAAHLLNETQNERIRLHETRGTLANDPEATLIEMETYGLAADTAKPLYHASINPEAHLPLTDAQIRIAVDVLEEALGLSRQPRLVVVHEKAGRQHVHAVWSRVDTENGRAISDAWNYRHHEHAARTLEALFGHRPVPGSHAPRLKRERTVTDYEQRQTERTGTAASQATETITQLWDNSASAEIFRARLEEAGYRLARGDRRVLVVIDRHGEVHSLARRIKGINTRTLKEQMAAIPLEDLPSVAQARSSMRRENDTHTAFTSAARQVTQPTAKRIRKTSGTLRVTKQLAAASFEVVTGAQHGAGPAIPARVARRTAPGALYRSLRASLIAEFASKLADARHNAPADERDALIAALLSAREAALERLGSTQSRGPRSRRYRTGPRSRLAKLRFRRIRLNARSEGAKSSN